MYAYDSDTGCTHVIRKKERNDCEKESVANRFQLCDTVVPPSVYQDVTLVFRESSGFSCACGRLYFLMLQLPSAFCWIKMSVPTFVKLHL